MLCASAVQLLPRCGCCQANTQGDARMRLGYRALPLALPECLRLMRQEYSDTFVFLRRATAFNALCVCGIGMVGTAPKDRLYSLSHHDYICHTMHPPEIHAPAAGDVSRWASFPRSLTAGPPCPSRRGST